MLPSHDASDRLTWKTGDLVLPQCSLCVHLDPVSPVAVCPAFPAGIPLPILSNGFDHRRPWPDQLAPVLFSPAPGTNPVALEQLGQVLDATH